MTQQIRVESLLDADCDMALYDDRLADLSESRRASRSAGRPSSAPGERALRSGRLSASKRPSMEIQSLLFARDAWTVAKAKQWAKANGYKYGTVDVTDQYVRLQQFSPEGLKVKRTITLGRGIRAVVAREENMAGRKTTRRRTTRKKAPAKKKRAAPKKRSTRKARKGRATEARRRKRSSQVMEAPRRRRKKSTARRAAPKRRRRTRTSEAWYGDTEGHRKAAKKGVRRRKRRASTRRRSRSRASSTPRRTRRRRSRVSEAPRRRRSRVMAPRRSSSKGMDMGQFAVALVSAGVGFVLADGLDRLLATYNPASTEAKPKDKFTSDGAGTLANTLNIASAPGFVRIGAGLGLTALPAVASMYVDGKYTKSMLQGAAIGMGVSVIKNVVTGVIMPLLKPKDTSPASLQKSYIARLYPAEVAASINRKAGQTTVSSGGGAGALSGAEPQPGVGGAAPDVGPFALSGDSDYPDAAQALRRDAGMAGGTPGNDFPTVQQTWGTGAESDYPTAAQAMGTGAPGANGNPGQPGVSANWEPGPPPLPGPGPKATPGSDPQCACLGDDNQYLGFVGDPVDDTLFPAAAE